MSKEILLEAHYPGQESIIKHIVLDSRGKRWCLVSKGKCPKRRDPGNKSDAASPVSADTWEVSICT